MVFPNAVLKTCLPAPSSSSLPAIRPASVVEQCSPVRILPISSRYSLAYLKPLRFLSLRSARSQKSGRAGFLPPGNASKRSSIVSVNASKRSSSVSVNAADGRKADEEEQQEEEVELSWVEEKVEDLVQFSSATVRALPGPRVGDGELPWLLALPMGYAAIALVMAVVKTVQRQFSPKEKRRRQVGTNAWLVAAISEYFPGKRDQLDTKILNQLAKKCNFDIEEVLRKYIRYALNEKPFNPELVTDLIHLRKVSMLDDKSVAEILNEVSRRIVKAKGPVIVDTTGFTEKGLKRKVAVQALFSKVLYLSELDEFCAKADRSSLSIKEIFGVTDEDANLIRIETLSGEIEVESLEQLVQFPADEQLDEET